MEREKDPIHLPKILFPRYNDLLWRGGEKKRTDKWAEIQALTSLATAQQHLISKRIKLLIEGEDGGGVRRGDHLPSHRYSRNTSTRGTAPTEHPLNAGRRPQTSQKARNSPHIWGGQKKKEKTETKNRDGPCTSGREP